MKTFSISLLSERAYAPRGIQCLPTFRRKATVATELCNGCPILETHDHFAPEIGKMRYIAPSHKYETEIEIR